MMEVFSDTLKEIVSSNDSKFSKEAVETLIKIHRTILHNPDEVKYRQIKTTNPGFYRKIWMSNLLQNFMHLSGWREINGLLVFNSDEKLLHIIEALLECRESIVPLENEWDSSTKHEGKSEAQLKEEKLRAEAAIKRQEELSEYLKDKMYREALAQNVKNQIREDRNRRAYYTHPVRGNKLVKGAKIRTLNSMNETKQQQNRN